MSEDPGRGMNFLAFLRVERTLSAYPGAKSVLLLCLWFRLWAPGLCRSLELATGCEGQTVLLSK